MRTRSGVMALFFLIFTGIVIAAEQPKPTDQNQLFRKSVTAQEIVIPYWTVEPGWRTELELGNNATNHVLIVSITVRNAEGAETTLSEMSIGAGEMRVVDLRAIIGSAEASVINGPLFGSLVLRYRAPGWATLYASVMIYREGHPISFHIPAVNVLTANSSRLGVREAIWWLPQATADGLILLTNVSDSPITVKLTTRN